MPPRTEPRFSRSIDLAALPTAILCTRLFVASTLQMWGARFLEADAERLAVELVRHSVETCGVIDPNVRLYQLEHVNVIHVRLLGFERTIGIEVWDNASEPVRLSAYDDRGDELHGLALVDARAKDWGSAVTPRGRVVWAELEVYERTASGLPIRTRRPSPRPKIDNDRPMPLHNLDLLDRVRNGLKDL
jgi:hypothetical protein